MGLGKDGEERDLKFEKKKKLLAAEKERLRECVVTHNLIEPLLTSLTFILIKKKARKAQPPSNYYQID